MTPQNELDQLQAQVRQYFPGLLRGLLLTYILPILGTIVISLVAIPLLATLLPILPGSTAAILAFGANLLILVYGWRYFEGRTQATALFVQYVAFANARRSAQKRLDEDNKADGIAPAREAAQLFIESAREAGIQAHDTDAA